MPPWRGPQSSLQEFSKIIVKVGYKWACSLNLLFHTFRKKNVDVQFNLHTTAASTLNKILSSIQHAKDIKEELEIRDMKCRHRRHMRYLFCNHWVQLPSIRSPKTNFQAPSESQPKVTLFGHFRMASIWREEDHLGSLYTIQRKDIRSQDRSISGIQGTPNVKHITWPWEANGNVGEPA